MSRISDAMTQTANLLNTIKSNRQEWIGLRNNVERSLEAQPMHIALGDICFDLMSRFGTDDNLDAIDWEALSVAVVSSHVALSI